MNKYDLTNYDYWVDLESGTYGSGDIALISMSSLPPAVQDRLTTAMDEGDDQTVVGIARYLSEPVV
jgi:hypothetical protein